MPGNEDNQQQLSTDELRELRELLEADRRAKWLWAGIRNVAVWGASVIGFLVITYQSFESMIKHLAGK